MNYSITQTRSKIWTFKAKENSLDEQIEQITLSIKKVTVFMNDASNWYKIFWKSRLIKLKKELTMLRKIKRS
ncbi:hypothetical protein LCGC14_2465200 [marine sediment metagenome]|uniref:Uncharacterized protein n=1 Tax=marine sediment metagenome TaxID=412755 RepID=A0A0F9BZT0_9ZZZZ